MTFNIIQSACDSNGGCNCIIVQGDQPITVTIKNSASNTNYGYGINWGDPTVPNRPRSNVGVSQWTSPVIDLKSQGGSVYITPCYQNPNGGTDNWYSGQIGPLPPPPNYPTTQVSCTADGGGPLSPNITIQIQAAGND